MSDHCPKCNRYLNPGASDCAFCGAVLGEDVARRSQQNSISTEDDTHYSQPSAISTFVAACMVLFGGIMFMVGCTISLFSFGAAGIVGGAGGNFVGNAILSEGIPIAVIGYFITKAGLAVFDRGRLQ